MNYKDYYKGMIAKIDQQPHNIQKTHMSVVETSSRICGNLKFKMCGVHRPLFMV